jgi:hypothetical protein
VSPRAERIVRPYQKFLQRGFGRKVGISLYFAIFFREILPFSREKNNREIWGFLAEGHANW